MPVRENMVAKHKEARHEQQAQHGEQKEGEDEKAGSEGSAAPSESDPEERPDVEESAKAGVFREPLPSYGGDDPDAEGGQDDWAAATSEQRVSASGAAPAASDREALPPLRLLRRRLLCREKPAG